MYNHIYILFIHPFFVPKILSIFDFAHSMLATHGDQWLISLSLKPHSTIPISAG